MTKDIKPILMMADQVAYDFFAARRSSHLGLDETFDLFITLLFIKALDNFHDGGNNEIAFNGKWDQLKNVNDPYSFLLGDVFPSLQKLQQNNLVPFFITRNNIIHSIAAGTDRGRDHSLLTNLIKTIDSVSLSSLSQEERYLFITQILDNISKQSNHHLLHLRTPKVLRDFMVAILNIENDQNILDMSCGTGALLFDLYFNQKDGFKNSTCQYTGIDINRQPLRVAMFTNYFTGAEEMSFIRHDTIKDYSQLNLENKFDRIIMEPPFGIRLDIRDIDKQFNVRTRNGDSIFLEAAMKSLSEDGLACLIIPGAVLSQMANSMIRRELIENFQLLSIISLPNLNPRHGVSTYMIVFKKTNLKTDVLFVDLRSNFSRQIDEKQIHNQLNKGLKLFNQYKSTDYDRESFLQNIQTEESKTSLVWFATVDDIINTEYRLDPYIFRPINEIETPPLTNLIDDYQENIQHILKEIEALKALTDSIDPMDDSSIEERSIEEICNIRMGKPLQKNEEIEAGELPWIQIGDMTKSQDFFVSEGERRISEEYALRHNLLIVEANTLLLSVRGTLGVVKISKQRMCISPTVAAFELNTDLVDPWFLLGWLLNNKILFQSSIQGAIPSITLTMLRRLKIKLPSPDHEISVKYVNVMKKLNTIKQLTTANDPQLDLMANSIFNQFFNFKE